MSVNPADHTSTPERASRVSATRRFVDVPGPKGWPLLGNAPQIQAESFHQTLEGWAREFDGTFRFRLGARDILGISDPAAIAMVLRQRPEVFSRGPRLVSVSKDLGFYGVFSANGEAWRRQRPIVMAGLDPAHLRTYLPSVAGITTRLQARWLDAARAGREIDLLPDLMRYTVDVTTSLAFGRNLNTLEQGDRDAIQQHLNVIFPAMLRRILAPIDVEHWLPKPALRRHVAALRQAVQGFILEARQQMDRQPGLMQHPENLLQALIAASEAGGERLGDEELSGNVLTMLLAGEDTTANTLGWLVWLLHGHPDEWRRARDEVDAVVGQGTVPHSIDQLGQLDVIEACANEALRLKPVAPVNILEATQEVVVGDVLVPPGTFVACVMRPPGLERGRFGEPEAFRPSRWMKGGHAEAEGMLGAKRVVMPFGGGPRVCPGRYLALAEIKMVMAMLLASFDIAAMKTPPGGPAERMSLTVSPIGLSVRLVPRRAVAVDVA